MKAGMSEKRKMKRFGLQLLSRVGMRGEDRDQGMKELLTKNICAGGAFIQTNTPFPVGTEVNVEVIFPVDQIKEAKGESSLAKVTGSVIRCDEEGMAICFDEDYQILPLKR